MESWEDKIRSCYKKCVGTGDLYEEMEAIIEVVSDLLAKEREKVADDVLQAGVYFCGDSDGIADYKDFIKQKYFLGIIIQII